MCSRISSESMLKQKFTVSFSNLPVQLILLNIRCRHLILIKKYMIGYKSLRQRRPGQFEKVNFTAVANLGKNFFFNVIFYSV